ncbi:MAG: DegV family EDD domain-containing protein [Anaerolineales bacterium]|nr:DegV family EDD domain-containing protein [Anaerolineales bacterium]
MGGQKIAIVTDSSAYIPEDAQVGLNISVIPLWLIWDEERYRDGVDITPQAFYDRLRKSDTLPTSSQPSAKEFETFFREVGEQCDAIVAVLASSKISGTVASAQAALSELPDFTIRIVDSYSSSMGLGLVVLGAARSATAGKSLDEVVEIAEKMRAMTQLLFAVDTLEYLHKGGRIGTARRFLGTALQIKPILQFKDGLIGALSQARTKSKAVEHMLDLVEERLSGKKMAEAAIVDIDCPEEGEELKMLVIERFNPPVIHRADVSPVVGTHVGPGGLGVAFYPEE